MIRVSLSTHFIYVKYRSLNQMYIYLLVIININI